MEKKSKRRIPKFRRQEWFRFKRLGEKWRRPRGGDSKMRLGKSGKPAMVAVGYRMPRLVRGLHPSGFTEVIITNPAELEKVDPTKQAARIAASVGERKREQIIKLAEERGVRVLNPRRKKRAEHPEKVGS